MADTDRKHRNAAKLRRLITEVERTFWREVSASEHFDLEIQVSVKDGVMQEHVQVRVNRKSKLTE